MSRYAWGGALMGLFLHLLVLGGGRPDIAAGVLLPLGVAAVFMSAYSMFSAFQRGHVALTALRGIPGQGKLLLFLILVYVGYRAVPVVRMTLGLEPIGWAALVGLLALMPLYLCVVSAYLLGLPVRNAVPIASDPPEGPLLDPPRVGMKARAITIVVLAFAGFLAIMDATDGMWDSYEYLIPFLLGWMVSVNLAFFLALRCPRCRKRAGTAPNRYQLGLGSSCGWCEQPY